MVDEKQQAICTACRKPFEVGQIVVASGKFKVMDTPLFHEFKLPVMNRKDLMAIDYWHEECVG